MKQITPDNIIILHPKITKNLFDLLGEIQINWKGMDWCSTGLSCEQGLIKIFPEKYNALAEPLRIRPDGVASINISFRNFPERFEHLLQIVRVNFPGISFQDIYIFNRPGYLDIYKYRYKPPTDWNFFKNET